jgi:hypothetical protein
MNPFDFDPFSNPNLSYFSRVFSYVIFKCYNGLLHSFWQHFATILGNSIFQALGRTITFGTCIKIAHKTPIRKAIFYALVLVNKRSWVRKFFSLKSIVFDSKTHFSSILYLTPTYEGIYALLYFLNIISCIFIFWNATTCKSTHCGVQLYMQRCCDNVCHCGGTTLLLRVLLQCYHNTHTTLLLFAWRCCVTVCTWIFCYCSCNATTVLLLLCAQWCTRATTKKDSLQG